MHYIQKYILDKLIYAKTLRNRDMRPPHVESNLYQYHLKRLIDSGYVKKDLEGYTLSAKGLQYADKHSSDLKSQRQQPKLVTVLLLENEQGEVLLVKRHKQPFIGLYSLPSGKIHEDERLLEAGRRELQEKTDIQEAVHLIPSGTLHCIIKDDRDILSEFYGFLLRGTITASQSTKGVFCSLTSDQKVPLMPGVAIIRTDCNQTSHQEITIDINQSC